MGISFILVYLTVTQLKNELPVVGHSYEPNINALLSAKRSCIIWTSI